MSGTRPVSRRLPDRTVALTFDDGDDGPDPRWTTEVLAVLRKYHVPATFFVIRRPVACPSDEGALGGDVVEDEDPNGGWSNRSRSGSHQTALLPDPGGVSIRMVKALVGGAVAVGPGGR